MKVIFLYPEYYEIARFGKARKEYPPCGVMYLAAVAEQLCEEVRIQSVSNEIFQFDLCQYDMVLFSLSSSCTYKMMKKCRESSIFSPNTIFVAGGIHASLFPRDVFDDLKLDYLVKGEGEIAITKIIEASREGKACTGIKGILNHSNYNEDIEFADYVKDLDKLPLPARHLLPEEDYIMTGRLSIREIKMTHILVSRGCPFNCYFCGGINKNHRYRSATSVHDEIMYLKEKYSLGGFVINDENFTVNKKEVIKICRAIRDIGLPWSALSRVDTIDEEMVAELALSGCIELKFGLESGSDTMLKAMNKRCSVQQAHEALSLCARYGIKAKLFLIHGFPGENMTTTEETIRFLCKNQKLIDRVTLFRWTPLPGSYVYEHAMDYHLDLNKLTYENAIIYGDEKSWFIDNSYNEIISQGYNLLSSVVDKVNCKQYCAL